MEDEATQVASSPQIYTRKVRFYPTKQQRELFQRCADANRQVFNAANAYLKVKVREANGWRLGQLRRMVHDSGGRCVHVFQSGAHKGQPCQSLVAPGQDFFCVRHSKCSSDDPDAERGRLGISYAGFLNLQHVRRHVLLPDRDLHEGHPLAWQKDVPYDTRQLAIKECITAWKSALTNKRKGNIHSFDVGFKRKKSPRQIFHVNKDAFNPGTQVIFKTRAGGGKLRVRKRDLSKVLEGGGVTGDFVVQLVRSNRWYLCLPKTRNDGPRATTTFSNPVHKSVFLDPGVRTFQTMYSPDGIVGKVGDGYWDVLTPLARRIDRLQRRKTQVYSRHRRRMHRRVRKLWHRLGCKVDDLHNKACRLLCTMFQTIFIPRFEASRMSERPGRKISCKTTRAMLTLSHGRFLAKLQAYARTKHRTVIVVSEAYTTKTCGKCGALNDNVGAAKVFACPACNHRTDRDVHAARNIMLRTLEALKEH